MNYLNILSLLFVVCALYLSLIATPRQKKRLKKLKEIGESIGAYGFDPDLPELNPYGEHYTASVPNEKWFYANKFLRIKGYHVHDGHIPSWYNCKSCHRDFQTSPPSYVLGDDMGSFSCPDCEGK